MDTLILTLAQGTQTFDPSADSFGVRLAAAIEEHDQTVARTHTAELETHLQRADGFRDIVVGEIVRRRALAAAALKEDFDAAAETAFLTGAEISPTRLGLHYERTPAVAAPQAVTTGGIVQGDGGDADAYTVLGVEPATTN